MSTHAPTLIIITTTSRTRRVLARVVPAVILLGGLAWAAVVAGEHAAAADRGERYAQRITQAAQLTCGQWLTTPDSLRDAVTSALIVTVRHAQGMHGLAEPSSSVVELAQRVVDTACASARDRDGLAVHVAWPELVRMP